MNRKIIEMELEAARAECELAKELEHTIYRKLLDSVTTCLENFLTPVGAHLKSVNISRSWNDDSGLEFSATFGFMNDETSSWDFGSDVDLRFTHGGRLSFNSGTIGTYTVEDKYQVARVHALAYVFNNIGVIEAELEKLSVSEEYIAASDARWVANQEVNRIVCKLKEADKEEIEKKLVVGATLEYREDVPTRDRMWGSYWNGTKDRRVVSKINPKTVKLTMDDGFEISVSKEKLINCLYREDILFVK